MENMILEFYKMVFNKKYDDLKLDDRRVIHSIIYIAERKGLNLGNFSFLCKNKAVYSIDLRLEITKEVDNQHKYIDKITNFHLMFSDFALDIIRYVNDLLNLVDITYAVQWVEIIASLHYIAKHKVFNSTYEDVRNYLLKEIPEYNTFPYSFDIAWKKAMELN